MAAAMNRREQFQLVFAKKNNSKTEKVSQALV